MGDHLWQCKAKRSQCHLRPRRRDNVSVRRSPIWQLLISNSRLGRLGHYQRSTQPRQLHL